MGSKSHFVLKMQTALGALICMTCKPQNPFTSCPQASSRFDVVVWLRRSATGRGRSDQYQGYILLLGTAVILQFSVPSPSCRGSTCASQSHCRAVRTDAVQAHACVATYSMCCQGASCIVDREDALKGKKRLSNPGLTLRPSSGRRGSTCACNMHKIEASTHEAVRKDYRNGAG